MRITKLDLEDFHQFENLELDFTYPKSHVKAGQPLEKICLIGQSGTGKTTLLKLIANHLQRIDYFYRNGKNEGMNLEEEMFGDWNYTTKNVRFCSTLLDEIKIEETNLGITFTKLANSKKVSEKEMVKMVEKISRLLIFMPAELIETTSQFLLPQKDGIQINKEFEDSIKTQGLVAEAAANYKIKYKDKIIILDNKKSKAIWQFLLQEIEDYNKKLLRKSVEVWQKGNFKDLAKIENDRLKWREENPNPKIPLAKNCLNPILRNFNLEVDIDNSEGFIVLKLINHEQSVPSGGISTGTKQFMLSAIPLYKLNTDKSIILLDEPERSLFPDIQLELIDYYTQMCPNAQFFVATHSPIIAASFEPNERFILYFDDNGKVCVRQGVSPKGDDPNDLLQEDFNVHLLNKYGIQMWERYLEIKKALMSEEDEIKRRSLTREYRTIGDNYNFEP